MPWLQWTFNGDDLDLDWSRSRLSVELLANPSVSLTLYYKVKVTGDAATFTYRMSIKQSTGTAMNDTRISHRYDIHAVSNGIRWLGITYETRGLVQSQTISPHLMLYQYHPCMCSCFHTQWNALTAVHMNPCDILHGSSQPNITLTHYQPNWINTNTRPFIF